MLGAGAESGVDFEPIEGNHTNGVPEVGHDDLWGMEVCKAQ